MDLKKDLTGGSVISPPGSEGRLGEATCTGSPSGSMWDCCCSPCRLNYKVSADSINPVGELQGAEGFFAPPSGQDLLGNPEVSPHELRDWRPSVESEAKAGQLRVCIDSEGEKVTQVQALPIEATDSPTTGDVIPAGKTTPPVSAVVIGAVKEEQYWDTHESIKTNFKKTATSVGYAGVSIQEGKDPTESCIVVRAKSIDNVTELGPVGQSLSLILNSMLFKSLSFISIVCALFLGAVFILASVPDSPGVWLQDAIMVAVFVFFVVEMVLKLIVEKREYLVSFFFWMDLLGTFSMVFEISFLLGTAGQMDDRDNNPGGNAIFRAARVTRVSARAGRLSKVIKVFNFIHRPKQLEGKNSMSAPELEARVLNAKLNTALASRVAMLTIILVVGVPLLNIGRFPPDDLSFQTWARALEVDYSNIYDDMKANAQLIDSRKFDDTTKALKDFYSSQWYEPFRIEGFKEHLVINSISRTIYVAHNYLNNPEPDRKDFIVKQVVDRCRAARDACEGSSKSAILFDFTTTKQMEACMDITMIVFVIAVMAIASMGFTIILNRMVVEPVERMLGTVRMMAKVLQLTQPGIADKYTGVTEITDEDLEEVAEKAKSTTVSETELLETVFSKLAKLTAVFMKSSIVDEAEMSSLDYESKGVLLEIMHMEQAQTQVSAINPLSKKGEHINVVENLLVEVSVIESWQLDLLGLQREHQHQVVTYIMFDSKIGSQSGYIWVDPEIFSSFLQAVRAGYLTNPYHNFIHACDVLAVVFRMLLMVRGNEWITDVDMCALLIAALCHDIGHGGKTTPFLMETNHELALRYNDKSPLENMHASRLFEIVKDPWLNVFSRFNRDAYKQARKICINTILHTDNALHFDMVKEVKKFYELTQDTCDSQERASDLLPEYKQDVLQKDTLLWLKLLLHMSDISTPLKPFWISKQWATRVQDEFFAQGDEEKRLGIPVGMLNDRDKVNRAGSEHGFINFLVSPLILPTVGLFPGLHPLAVQMCDNMESWKALWIETGPSSDDIKKREEDIQKNRDKVAELTERKLNSPGFKPTKTGGASMAG